VWERAPEKIYKSEPATAALAASLKKDTKVYASVDDDGSDRKNWRIESISMIPADSTVP
jgi:hypothetical protein